MTWKPAFFEPLPPPPSYPEVTWEGTGLVSDVRTPSGGSAGWLVLRGEELEFLADPDAPDTTPVVILGELSSLRAEGVASRVAFDYVLVDREHSDPESTGLAAFRKTWDEERKP